MNRKTILLAFVGLAFTFSTAAALACGSCGTSAVLALAGMGVYATLFILGAYGRQDGILTIALYLAGGFHAGLLASMIYRGSVCIPCIGAAAGCFGAILTRPFTCGAAGLLPWTAALALAIHGPVPEVRTDRLHMVVYTSDQCPYCEILRTDVLPEAVRDIDVEIEFKPAESEGWVTRTPTMLITGPGSQQVYEGVPHPATLMNLLLQVRGDR